MKAKSTFWAYWNVSMVSPFNFLFGQMIAVPFQTVSGIPEARGGKGVPNLPDQ